MAVTGKLGTARRVKTACVPSFLKRNTHCLFLLDRKLDQSPNFKTFKESKNRLQGFNSASLYSLADRYDNPLPTQFLTPIVRLKFELRCQRE